MMPRGRAWTWQEVGCLLALVRGSGAAALLMASTSRPNEALWRAISGGLAAAGYSRNVAQCRSKWKALKQAFYSEWQTCQQAGGHSPRVPPHYKTMKKIWKAAGCPVFGERRLPDLGKLLPSCQNKPHPETEASPPSPQPRGLPAEGQETLVGLAGDQAQPVPAREKGSPEAAEEEQAAMGQQALSAPGTPGPCMVSLLQSMQQILVQILCTSQQQQLLLESLASDTVSHRHCISDNLVQVGESLQELLYQSQDCSTTNWADPVYGGPCQACSPGLPPTSPCLKVEAGSLPAPRCLAHPP
ncbi:uncharacterized protein LOC134400395 [Elgaria multicarinata webbii]|uniref:uncharacterized protein LOC134400395 n=1 Tax=Elgaria multicarinata webbii TaxID=159646 RepID=UPI002FCD5F33